MKAAIIEEKQNVVVKDVEATPLKADEVKIDVARCGICGSDLHWYHAKWSPPKVAPGHELVGTVAEVGEDVENVKPGDRVTVLAFIPCGSCSMCESGRHNLCENVRWPASHYHGGLAEFACTGANAVIHVTQALSDQQAALLEPAAVSYRACTRFGKQPCHRALVIGGGTIGLICVAVLRALGCDRIGALTKYQQQTEMARRLGATDVVQIGKVDPRKTLKELFPGGVDLAIDSVAAGPSVTMALQHTTRAGKVVLVGGITKPLLTMFGPLVGREIMMTGSNCYAYEDGKHDFEAVSDMMLNGTLDLHRLVTHTFPLEEAAEAFKVADDKSTGVIKVHVTQD